MTEELQNKLDNAYKRRESYSSLSLLKQCPHKYYLKYVLGNYATGSTIALDIGNLCHKIMELRLSPESTNTTYNFEDILKNGYSDDKEKVIGIEDIKELYFDEWVTPCRKSGLTYTQKLKTFMNNLTSSQNTEWEVVATEYPFEIEYNGVTIIGKIDKIEKNKNGEIKITDYKTSDKAYDDKDLKTPLQMFIYALACKNDFGEYPTVFEYDFVLLGEKREAMSKGWYNRGKKMLDKIISDRNYFYETVDYCPKPNQLCHWCDYCLTSCTTDDDTKDKCEYYSLWTPTNKTFETAKNYIQYSLKSPIKSEFEW